MYGIGPYHLMILAEQREKSHLRKAQQQALLEEALAARGDRPGRIARISGILICGLGAYLVNWGKRLECYSVRLLSPTRS